MTDTPREDSEDREELAHEVAGMLAEAATLAARGEIDKALDLASLAYEDWNGATS